MNFNQTSRYLVVFLITSFLYFQCASSNNNTRSSSDGQQNDISVHDPNVLNPNEKHSSGTSLASMLLKIPGVSVTGSDQNAIVKVRGAQSLNLTTEPLFVVDDVPLGRNFATVYRAINPDNIKRISVLKGADATLYGARGSNGVILIVLKKE